MSDSESMPSLSGVTSDVVRRAKLGDKVALERLLYSCNQSLRAHLAGRIPHEFAPIFSTDDIVQETCLRVQQQIKSLDSNCPEAFGAWVRRIAVNLLNSEIRAMLTKKRGGKRRKVSRENDNELVSGVFDETLTPSHATELNEIIVAIHTNISDLSTTERRAVQRHHIEKATLTQTAKELGITRHELRGVLTRAKRKMRQMMGTSSKWFRKK